MHPVYPQLTVVTYIYPRLRLGVTTIAGDIIIIIGAYILLV